RARSTGGHGPRVPLVASGVLTAAGMALLLGLSPGTSYLQIAIALAVLGAGLGLVNPPITNTGVSGMPPAQAGVTTGVRAGMKSGQTHAAALSAATHSPWALALACGLGVAVVGYLTTTARAHASAAAALAEPQPTEPPPTDMGSRGSG